jgi:hypothetical protein
VHWTFALQSDPGLVAVISISEAGTSAKFIPMMVTGIPEAPVANDWASLLTLVSRGGGVERRVHEDMSVLVQATHVALENRALQSKDDSQPSAGSALLLNLPLVQDEMTVQVAASEHTEQVAVVNMELQSKDDSQPSAGSALLSNLPPVQDEMAVQVDESEHEAQVAAVTEGHPASQPLPT